MAYSNLKLDGIEVAYGPVDLYTANKLSSEVIL